MGPSVASRGALFQRHGRVWAMMPAALEAYEAAAFIEHEKVKGAIAEGSA